MAKPQARFVCQECGAVAARWTGRCEACNAWNSLQEEAAAPPGSGPRATKRGRGKAIDLASLDAPGERVTRLVSGISEFDTVVGGGLVEGSALLVGGDPGIGKSTLLLQIAAALATAGHRIVYISGEEAPDQVRLRAIRLGVTSAPVELGTATGIADILETLERGSRPALVVIDSVQTMWDSTVESSPGTVAQVRASSQALIGYAKSTGSAVVLVGHVTKDGQIAGPRVVEHMVDAVLYFEGDRGHQFRILRAVKNRFGPTDEIGVFEMTGTGLQEVDNPSALFLSARDTGSPGAAVFAGVEGTRPVLVEIQALVAPSSLGTPRRAVVGADSARLSMLIAVLEARCGVSLSGQDVYLNIAGGLRIQEPAADLAVAAALLSSFFGIATESDAVFFGEVSLSGALRPAPQTPNRLREAEKLGFTMAYLPPSEPSGKGGARGIDVIRLDDLAALVARFATKAQSRAQSD